MPDRSAAERATVEVIRSPQQMQEALGIRFSVFVEEQQVPIEEEVDAFDDRPGERDDVVQVLVRLDGSPAATARLLLAHEGDGYPHIGRNPHVLWTMLPTSKRHANRNVVPGAVLLFRNSRVGHAVVYLGGGLSLSTDYPTTGKWSIGPADEIERSFGTLLGWYSPSCAAR